ncbi:MAG TPA: glycoside hydrolase family 16 protein, partial [Bacteroidetes bacterium]|nr:glycoside hydrolase family 16 protein [Bacteroidota bacterium]
GGDDKEHELVFEAPAQNNWINYHLALADFTNLTTKSNISQIIFSATPAGSATAFIDNVFFSKEAVTPTPTVAAADPTDLQANVISLFSNVYTDVTVDTWRTSWSSADLEEIQVAGNDVKKYG